MILGWLARERDAPRKVSSVAIGANAAALIVVVAAIVIFGGS
jgi:hypothetical protein